MGRVKTNTNHKISKYKTKPLKHQAKTRKKYYRAEVYALLGEMGTGKTWIIIDDLADLWAADKCGAALVIAPNGVHSNWTRLELPKHMPDWVRYRAITWTANPNKTEKAELDNMYVGKSGELIILTMNTESLQTKRGFEFAKSFCETARKLMIVVDEADDFKNPSAVRTKSLMRLKPFSDWRRIMTGTLINNAPFDAFAPFSFLDEEILETTSFYAFKAEYAEMHHKDSRFMKSLKEKKGLKRIPQIVMKGVDGKPKYKNLDRLSKLIAPYSDRVLLKDCVDLPEKIHQTLIFRLTKQQIKHYKLAKKECRIIFEGTATPFIKLVAITKLAQITSGYYIHPLADDPVKIEGDNPKLDMLEERVIKFAGVNKKMIIWARYRAEIDDIAQMLKRNGIKFVEYHGGVKKRDRPEAIDAFEEGDAQVFLANPQAGGTGLTLVSAHFVLRYSHDYSFRKKKQSDARSYRIGLKHKVIYIDLVGKGTIEEHAIRVVDNKQSLSETIVDIGLKLFGGK